MLPFTIVEVTFDPVTVWFTSVLSAKFAITSGDPPSTVTTVPLLVEVIPEIATFVPVGVRLMLAPSTRLITGKFVPLTYTTLAGVPPLD